MSTIYEIRKANLKLLVQQRDATSIAQACGYSGPSYISQLCGRNAQRSIKEDTARKIETALALPHGWMDVERDPFGNNLPHPGGNPTPPVDREDSPPISMLNTDHFERVAEIVGKYLDETGLALSHTKFAQLVSLVYEQDTDDEGKLRAYISKIHRLIK